MALDLGSGAWDQCAMSQADAGATQARPAMLPRIDASRCLVQADHLIASIHEVVRQIGWFLERRAQLVRERRPPHDGIPALSPLTQACRAYYENVSTLSDQLLHAQTQLEHLLAQAHAPVSTERDATVLPRPEPMPLDLYGMMFPLGLQGEDVKPLLSAESAVGVSDDTHEPSPSFDAKRRKTDDDEVPLDTGASPETSQPSARDMLDFSWLDFASTDKSTPASDILSFPMDGSAP